MKFLAWPIWLAGITDATFALVGRLGGNLLCTPVFGLQGKSAEKLLEDCPTALHERGHDPARREIATITLLYCRAATSALRIPTAT